MFGIVSVMYRGEVAPVRMPDPTNEAMRETHPAQAERIVFMTGGAFSAKAQELLANARHEHVMKPFDPVTVRSIVRALVK